MEKPILALRTLAAVLAIVFATVQAVQTTAQSLRATQRSLVFNKNDDGAKFYRIPALAVTTDGTLIAVADRRNDALKDLPGNIDVVCRTSSDSGRTWSKTVTIAACDSTGGYGDPAVAVDPASGDIVCVMTHGNGLWESTPDNHARIVVTRSSDNGMTWSRPVDITGSLFHTDAEPDVYAPIKCVSAFASSGSMATLRNGRLMFVLVVRDSPKKWSKVKDYACFSDDGGITWQVAGEPADTDGDEAKIVELDNGDLLMSIRNRRKGAHKFALSANGGKTWTEPRHEPSIIEPACNGDILRYKKDSTDILVLSVPNHEKERTHVSLFAGTDNGSTWSKIATVCAAPSAYSSLAVLPDGSLGCLAEEGAHDGGWRIWFTRFENPTP